MSLIVLIYTFTGILFNYKHSLNSVLLTADSYTCALHESGKDQSLKRLLGALKPRKPPELLSSLIVLPLSRLLSFYACMSILDQEVMN